MEFGSKYVYMKTADEDEEIEIDDGAMQKLSLDIKSESEDEQVCLLDILDTAGQAEFSALREQYMRESQAFVIVYAINNKNSFQEALDIHTLALRMQKASSVPAILCGNKSDLDDERQVPTDEAEKEATARGMAFLETSAKTGANIQEAFETLIKRTPRHGLEYKVCNPVEPVDPFPNSNYKGLWDRVLIALLGSGGVGKSSIIIRFTQDMFVPDYDPTIEDSFRKTINVKGIPKDMLFPKPKEAPMMKGPEPPMLESAVPPMMEGPKSADFFPKPYEFVRGPGAVRVAQVAVPPPPPPSPPPSPPPPPPRRRPPLPLPPPSAPLPRRPKKVQKTKKTDGNIILVSLGTLENDPQIMTGDAVECSNCPAILSHVSEVGSGESTKRPWKCEFCDHQNEVDITDEEIPKESQVDFLVDAAPEAGSDSGFTMATDKPQSQAEVVLYCIDVSSSMGNKTALPRLQAEWYALRQNNITSVSRLDCIKQAVQRQLDFHEIETPEKKAGLVPFGSIIKFLFERESQVNYRGVANNVDELLKLGQEYARTETLKPLSENAETLKDQVKNLRLAGSTALGPALTLAVGFLSKLPGSEIVLCTDGLPNEGVGSLPRDPGFYDKIGEIAKNQQTTISVIGIQTGQEYEIETVSKAAAITGGNINLLNPHELSAKMREITQDVVVATNVEVTALLHPYLCFVSVKADVNNKSVAKCTLGNVHKNTELTFRFQRKAEFKDVEVPSLPFQVQVLYTTKDGRRLLRVLTEKRETTQDRDQMETNLNIPVVGATAMKESAALAQGGDLSGAKIFLKQNQWMQRKTAARAGYNEESSAAYLNYEKQAIDLCGEMEAAPRSSSLFQTAMGKARREKGVWKLKEGGGKKPIIVKRSKASSLQHQAKYYEYQ
ncbi:Circularly permutated Ras protein 1 [Holothuria leucospilota]|uniref:Circularly permutated Ras protein 1 n=1 Tax=Holothuria leucospilota TaxID=206669 RepID=A0A9Q1HI20_HOLLE|nr:Circularly permutated Ras protein 1 [Holothuria leucospilota]